MVSNTSLPLKFHENLLAALDNGINPNKPRCLVSVYHCDWWNMDLEPGAPMYLRHADLNEALRVHEEQCLYRFAPPIATCPQVDLSPDCPKCPAYHDLVADAFAELRGILEYANATETAAQNRYETDMRWAQGLYILHEAVL